MSRNVAGLGANFFDPTGIAITPNGALYVADPNAFGSTGGIIRVDAATGVQTVVSRNATGLGANFVDPRGLAIAPDGTLYVADANAFGGTGGVLRIDPTSGVQTIVSRNATGSGASLVDPSGIAFDELLRTLYVADPNAFGGTGGLIRVDPATGAQVVVSRNAPPFGTNFVDPTGLTVVPAAAVPEPGELVLLGGGLAALLALAGRNRFPERGRIAQ